MRRVASATIEYYIAGVQPSLTRRRIITICFPCVETHG
ncbi:MAG: hypothetical protein QOH25_359 [Acidobacteriota bacterium]|jgi:hypothetical protein|nr:hypothetical protein [Acidobacteriota bacterium]